MILLLCDLPKPIHGMSLINSKMKLAFNKSSQNVIVINSCPSFAHHFFGKTTWHLIRFFYFLFCLLKILIISIPAVHRYKVCYRSINGGSGQFYDVLYLMSLRLFRYDIVVHHHSFAYLRKKNILTKVLFSLAGKKAKHIVLGDSMRIALVTKYAIPESCVLVISNSAFLDAKPKKIVSNQNVCKPLIPIKIGHLSNLCTEKGVVTVIEHCKKLYKKGYSIHLHLAGPFANAETEFKVSQLISELSWVTLHGPLYSKEKDAYFKMLDVFYFPSQYKNEAEPLVLYEAVMNGVYLIGTSLGCMGDIISGFEGGIIHSIKYQEFEREIDLFINKCDFALPSKLEDLYYTQYEKNRRVLIKFISELESCKN